MLASRVGRSVAFCAGVVVILGLAFVAIVLPRGARLYQFGEHGYYDQRRLTQTITVHNPDWDERIVGVSAGAAGVRLVRAAVLGRGGTAAGIGRSGADVGFRGSTDVTIRLWFTVTDCAVAPTDPIPVFVHLSRWGLTHTEAMVDHAPDDSAVDSACGRG